MRLLAALLVIAVSAPLLAQEQPLPRDRPEASAEAGSGEVVVPLPRPRPEPEAVRVEPIPEVPPPPPPRIYQAACPAALSGRIEATSLEPLADGACGERSPLAVTAILVNGRMVPLSGEVIVNCGVATILPDWAEAIDGYLAAREGTRLARILVGTSYACRNRNNATSSDLSEHGFANALDVTGFELEDGRTIALPGGWADPLSPAGRLLRFAHDSACARFTTTLGPEANALHADHLHVDLGCHGARCTSRLCE